MTLIGKPIPSLWEFYKYHAQPAMIALARAGNRGVWVDLGLREKLALQTRAELEEAKKDISTLVGIDLNPGSPKQLGHFIYDYLRLPQTYDRRARAYTRSTKEQILEELSGKYPQHAALLNRILDFREKQKMLSTFLTSELDSRGKLVTSYHATGTVAGRISSSETIFGEGGNMQQFPRGEARRMIIAPPGRKLIKVDLSQAEARVVAWSARDEELVQLFLNPKFDVHTWNAQIGTGKTDIDKGTRHKWKQILHSSNYGGGPTTAVKHAKMSFHEAKIALEAFMLKRGHALRKWWSEIEMTLQGDSSTYFTRNGLGGKRMLRTPFGRRRIFLGRLEPSTFRSAYAFIPSATVADIINRAFFLLDQTFPPNAFPELQVHDEIVSECADNEVEECVALIRKHCMTDIYFPEVESPLRIPAEVAVGQNWFDMEKLP